MLQLKCDRGFGQNMCDVIYERPFAQLCRLGMLFPLGKWSHMHTRLVVEIKLGRFEILHRFLQQSIENPLIKVLLR